MSTVSQPPMQITLAVTRGISLLPLAALLAMQRAEEPQTPVRIHEVMLSELHLALSSGRYNAAIALRADAMAGWASESLWHDELALAFPVGSPLLAGAEIKIDMLRAYKVLLWPQHAHIALNGEIAALVDEAGSGSTASSFELMATWVAAGYCVGIAPRSRIMQARGWGIVLRSLADGPHRLTTKLLRVRQHCLPAVERFAERARRTGANHP